MPTEKVQDYVNDVVRMGQVSSEAPFSILDLPLEIDLANLHNEFINPRSGRMNICHSLRALCEVLWHYNCDVLLLTGRPSRLPGIQALIRQLQPVPPSRVLPLHGYETGGWYPFNKKGCIDDPKSTASVGAMLYLLAENSRLSSFFFRTHPLSRHAGWQQPDQRQQRLLSRYRSRRADIPASAGAKL